MRELETLIEAITRMKVNCIECKALKNDSDYQAYLLGKEEAFTTTLRLLEEYKRILNENSNKA